MEPFMAFFRFWRWIFGRHPVYAVIVAVQHRRRRAPPRDPKE
jgi:hypothetical protein